MATVKVAVEPGASRGWLRDAVVAGGGEVVEPDRAEALVWTEVAEPERLTRLLEAHAGIRWVQLPWAGVEPYAEAGVLDHDHTWTCGKGVYAEPVAEHALALALGGLRNFKRFATARTWTEQSGFSLVGGNVTIFGAGGIAEWLVKLLEPFGCSITVVRKRQEPFAGADRVLGFEERFESLQGADVVFVACALTPETQGLIGAIEMELMEPHAWLVNVARGEHVVTNELLSALRGDVIGGAALDVTFPEPLPDGHPLWELPNCLITPHTANTEAMARPLLSERVTENVRRYSEDRPLVGLVDPDLGY